MKTKLPILHIVVLLAVPVKPVIWQTMLDLKIDTPANLNEH